MNVFDVLFTNFASLLPVLGIATIACIFTERAGIVNIGINGTMVFGAIGYVLFGHIFASQGGPSILEIPLLMIASLFGVLMGLLFGFAVIKIKANQIIVGVTINILAPALVWLIRIFFSSGGGTDLFFDIPELAMGDLIKNEPMNIFSFKMLLLIIVFVVSLITLNKTKWGLRYKSVGENPAAADSAGINVNRIQWQGIIISSALAGLAGGISVLIPFIVSDPGKFNGTVKGFGFLALSIMIVGRWRISWGFLASILFAFLIAFSTNMRYIIPGSESYEQILFVIPYLTTIIILLIFSKQSFGPKSAGIPYDKSKR